MKLKYKEAGDCGASLSPVKHYAFKKKRKAAHSLKKSYIVVIVITYAVLPFMDFW